MGRYEVIKAESYGIRYLNCPVQTEKYQILKDSETGKNVIRFVFVNYSDKVLTGLTFDIMCYSGDNTTLGTVSGKEIFAECEALGRFGKETVIDTPYDNIGKVMLLIKKASYENAPDWVADMGTLKAFNKKLVPVSDFQEDLKDELNDEISKSGIKHPDYVFSEFKEGWICTCGNPNTVSDEKCTGCKADKFLLRKMFSTAYLTRKKEQKQVKEEVKPISSDTAVKAPEKTEVKSEKPVSAPVTPEKKTDSGKQKNRKKNVLCAIIVSFLIVGILLAIILPVTLLGKKEEGGSVSGVTDVYSFVKTYGSQKSNGDYEYYVGNKYYYDEMYDITLLCSSDNSGFAIYGESDSSLIKIIADDKNKEVGYVSIKYGEIVFVANAPEYSYTSSDYSNYWEIVYIGFDESTFERALNDLNKYGHPVYDFLLSETENAVQGYFSLKDMGFSIKGSGSSAEYYSITTNTNIEGAGTYTTYSNSSKESGTSITLTASANSGYKFVGWYNGSTLLSSSSSYTFYMPSYDVTYTAKFQVVYKLSTVSNLQSAGTYTKFSSAEKTEGESVTLTASANSGYKFVGWYNGSTLLSSSSSYTFYMPSYDITYTAQFRASGKFKLTTDTNDSNGGTYTSYYQVAVDEDSSITLTASPADGYSFAGWYNGSTLLSSSSSYTFNMPGKDVTYTAKFAAYTLTTNTNLEGAGTYTLYKNGRIRKGESITLSANTANGYIWLGWYDGNTLLSNNKSYSFYMPDKSITYTAKWKKCTHGSVESCLCKDCGATVHNYSNGTCTACGDKIIQRVNASGEATSSGEYVLFGSYPQSLVENTTVKNQLSSKAGLLPTGTNSYSWIKDTYNNVWYQDISYNSNRYRGVYVSSAVYWFEYKPIKWRILSNSGGEALILAEMILDEYYFNNTSSTRTIDGNKVYANDWEYSSVRTWLNSSFYNYAFSDEQRELIKTQTLTTNKDGGTETTTDNVFLLTTEDVSNSAYEFSDNTSRQKKATDYAQQMGTYTSSDGSDKGNGLWWLRSSYTYFITGDFCVFYVSRDGDLDGSYYVSDTYYGVVPALKIKL